MKITLPLTFQPASDDWSAYCDYALKMLDQFPDASSPTLSWDDETEAFKLEGVAHVEKSCYFSAAEDFADTVGMLLKWAQCLGSEPADIIRPFVTCRGRDSENPEYTLRVRIDGTDTEIGIYRLCCDFIFNAHKISEPEKELLRSIANRLTS